MLLPLQIVFRDVARSAALEAVIREKTDKLGQFFDRIMSCRVTVGLIQKHKHQGKLFNIRVDLTVPGSEIVVNRDTAEDVYVAIRDAFDAAKRRLEEYARRLRDFSHSDITDLEAGNDLAFLEEAASEGRQSNRVSMGTH